jgi:hypothetical protein
MKKPVRFFSVSSSHGQHDSEKKAAQRLPGWMLSATAWFYGDNVGRPDVFSTQRVTVTVLRLLTLHLVLVGLILACAALA